MRWKKSALVVFLIFLITGCGKESKAPNTKPTSIAPPNCSLSKVFDQGALIKAAKKAALSYQDIYDSIPDDPNVDFVVPDDKIKQILNRVSALGFPVYAYNFNLRHSDQMMNFYRKIKSGNEALIAVFHVGTDGSITEYAFKYKNKQLYTATFEASLSYSTKQLSISNIDFASIDRYEFSNNGYFLYHTIHAASTQDYSSGFRVVPLPDKDYDLYKKYIEPVGYLGNNLFLTTWDNKTISRLNFNDMFQNIYRLEYKRDLDYESPYKDGTNACGNFISAVPASDFESVITKYFQITASQLQQTTVYDSSSDVYPFSYYFIEGERSLAPYAEVISSTDNKDGSITMNVDMPNLNNYDDCEIRHILTVNPGPGGSFQYLSNVVKINKFKVGWFPYYSTRISKEILK